MAGLAEVVRQEGLFCSLYTDRGSHFFHTPKAGGAVDKSQLTEIGRALAQLGIEHIPSYCPQGRGRMERFFGSWQGRLPQELGRAGITTLPAANRYIREKFLPWHRRHWTEPAQESATWTVTATPTWPSGPLPGTAVRRTRGGRSSTGAAPRGLRRTAYFH